MSALYTEGAFGNFGILGVCDWNIYGTFYYISGFAGYLLLAYYMNRYPLNWPIQKMCVILIPMFIAGYATTFGGYVLMQKYHPGDYSYLEIIWLFCGINVFLMTFPLFAVMRRVTFRTSKVLTTLSGLTFGIYLAHFPLESAGYDILADTDLPYWLRIISSAILIFTVTALLVWLMKHCRLTRCFVS